MKIIIEDRNFIDELENLQYEVQARKNIIGYMIEMGQMKTDTFQEYHNEYLKFFKAYELKKKEIELKYVKPAKKNVKSWNLDFGSGELTID